MANKEEVRKERPIWMSESTVITPGTAADTSESSLPASLPEVSRGLIFSGTFKDSFVIREII